MGDNAIATKPCNRNQCMGNLLARSVHGEPAREVLTNSQKVPPYTMYNYDP